MVSFGTSSQKQESKSTPVQQSGYTPEQEWLMRSLIGPGYGKISEGMNEPVPSYPRQLYVDRTPEEQQFFNYANQGMPDYIQRSVSGEPAWTANGQALEDYYRDYVKAPAMREYEQVALPGLKESFVGPGYYGSRRMEEQSRMGENLSTKLAAEKANLYWQNELSRRGALESAANRAAAVGVPAYQAQANVVGTAGALSRSIEEEKTLSDFTRWMAGETVDGITPVQNNPFMQYAMQMLNLFPMSTAYQSSSSGSGSGFNFGLSLANLAKG